jgi:hypothetical protein
MLLVTRLKLSFAACLISAAAPSSAQMFGNLTSNLSMNRMLLQPVVTQANRVMNESTSPVRSQNSSPSRSNTSVMFDPSIARRKANLSHFVEKTRATDPTGAAKMAQIFASTDIIGLIDQKMQSTYGMRANNVADAYAVWWTSAWMGAQGRSDDPTQGQMAMVKRQTTNALAATPEFASATDAGKQELAEALLVQAALIGDTIDTYRSDPAMLAKARAAIAKGRRLRPCGPQDGGN